MYFTQEDFKKIEKWLLQSTVKDTQFADAATPLKGNETIAFVQGNQNVKTTIKDFVDQLFLLGVADFLNVTDKYGEKYLSIEQAIQLIPPRSRKIGQVITFMDTYGNWVIYQFQGQTLNQWNNTTMWINVISSIIVSETVPDEEDLTGIKQNNKLVLKFKNKDYNTNDFSGLGRVYLRKNIRGITDPVEGTIAANVLTQQMVSYSYTIYHLQYDYNLNGETIIIPEGCTILFEGGSISNGTIIGTGTSIQSVDNNRVIFGLNIIIDGSWNIADIYDSWFEFDITPNKASNQLITNIFNLSNDDVNNTIHFEADRTYYFESAYSGNPALGSIVRPNYARLATDEFAYLRIFTITSNTHIIFNNTLRMLPTNQGAYFVFWVENKSNITINGTGSIYGDAHSHLYTDPFVSGSSYYGEFGHIFSFSSCNNILIEGITVSDAFGDCISCSTILKYQNNVVISEGYCNNIKLDSVKIKYARRNGVSGVCHNWSIVNCLFEGNGIEEIKGTAPMAAIDFESDHIEINPDAKCVNTVMSNCKFTNNKFDVSSTNATQETAQTYAVNVNNCVFTAPLRLNVTFWIKFVNCEIPYLTNVGNSVNYFTASKHLRFEDCVFGELYQYLKFISYSEGNEFINCTSPQDNHGTVLWKGNIGNTRVWKISIPRIAPEQSVLELTLLRSKNRVKTGIKAFIQLGDQIDSYIKEYKIYFRKDSTPSSNVYNQLPVFSNPVVNAVNNTYEIYFAAGDTILGTADEQYYDCVLYYTVAASSPKVHKDGISASGLPISGGIYSTLLGIDITSLLKNDLPSDVTFPYNEMFLPVRTIEELPNMNAAHSGTCKFVLESGTPVFWDSYKLRWSTADGYKATHRIITESQIPELEEQLTVQDRGMSFYVTDWGQWIYWRGLVFNNSDGTLLEHVKII